MSIFFKWQQTRIRFKSNLGLFNFQIKEEYSLSPINGLITNNKYDVPFVFMSPFSNKYTEKKKKKIIGGNVLA